ERIEVFIPRKWAKRIERYSANAQAIRSLSTWQIVLRAYMMLVVLHSLIIVAIIMLSSRYLLPLAEDSKFGNVVVAIATLVAISPFLWALALRRVAKDEVQQLISERKFLGPIVMMVLFR